MLKSPLLTTFSWFQLSVKSSTFAEPTLFHRMNDTTSDLFSKITFLIALGQQGWAPRLALFIRPR